MLFGSIYNLNKLMLYQFSISARKLLPWYLEIQTFVKFQTWCVLCGSLYIQWFRWLRNLISFDEVMDYLHVPDHISNHNLQIFSQFGKPGFPLLLSIFSFLIAIYISLVIGPANTMWSWHTLQTYSNKRDVPVNEYGKGGFQ